MTQMISKNGRTFETKSFASHLESLIEASHKTQREIAKEIGYDRPNIITMFKQGLTKGAIEKIPALAMALDGDPARLLRLALNEYMPEVLETIEQCLGSLLTSYEREVLGILRNVTLSAHPKLSALQREELERVLAGGKKIGIALQEA